jgi:hypothetical protein
VDKLLPFYFIKDLSIVIGVVTAERKSPDSLIGSQNICANRKHKMSYMSDLDLKIKEEIMSKERKPILTDALKQTVTDGRRFKTLSLVLESQAVCTKEFIRLGISPQTMSFILLGLERVTEELNEAAKYAKIQEEFNKITEGFEKKDEENGKKEN